MEVNDAIVRSIVEICEEKQLNATNFVNNDGRICWTSDLGILGKVKYHGLFTEFRESLENGLQSVSILIAFADLITQESNKGMIDNINVAKNRGAKTLFAMSSPDSNIMRMCVPKATNNWDYTTVPIRFTKTGDGEYEWGIPESAELYSSIYNDGGSQAVEGMVPEELSRVISEYTGLEGVSSSGVPVLCATESIRDYSAYYEPESMDDSDAIGRTDTQRDIPGPSYPNM